MRQLTTVQLGAIIRFTGAKWQGINARIAYSDMYGNPVLHITDSPSCPDCIKPAPADCPTCVGEGSIHRVRVYTVLPNGQYVAPLGGIANAVPLQCPEAKAWLAQEVMR